MVSEIGRACLLEVGLMMVKQLCERTELFKQLPEVVKYALNMLGVSGKKGLREREPDLSISSSTLYSMSLYFLCSNFVFIRFLASF